MRQKFKHIFIAIIASLFVFSAGAQVPQKPSPPRLVVDYTNTLTESQAQALEQKLMSLDNATSTQVAVVIVESTNGKGISDYNLELGRAWGVGSSKDNGVVLLIAKNDRKLDIAVGYGLEGSLPDTRAEEIIEEIIVPNFKSNDYYRGIDMGIDAIIAAVQGKYQTPRKQQSTGRGSGALGFVIFIIIMIIIAALRNRGGGKGGGNYMSRRGSNLADVLFWGSLLGGGGRSSGGGGWSGGGGGGGGFGGFGGGSFGGGGASGSW